MTRTLCSATVLLCLSLATQLTGCGGGDSHSPVVAPTLSLSANPTSVPRGESVALTWSSTDASSCRASGSWSGSKATAGTEMIGVGAAIGSVSFNLTCRGKGGTISGSVTVTIQPAPAPDVTFRADSLTVVSGTNTTLTWSSNAAECTASGGWSGSKAPNGTESVGPITAQTDYVLSCQNPGSLVHIATLTIDVAAPPEPIYSVLYNFMGGEDGENPYGLIVDEGGNLYGTTFRGGRFCIDAFDSCGTVFKLDPNGVLTTLHVFAGGSNDGASPRAGLVRDEAGNLYGGTYFGGAHGSGVVFKLNPSGKLTVLHHFNQDVDGVAPEVGFRDDAGNLYGTTGRDRALDNCTRNCGTVFRLSSAGKLTTLHTFNGRDGDEPSAPLIGDAEGNLYGTTARGGDPSECDRPLCGGTVFKLAPNGELTTLHVFNGMDGDTPAGRLSRDEAGNLYGTTVGGHQGFGVVYQLHPSREMTILIGFAGGNHHLGAHPEAGVVLDTSGKLYGTSRSGGAYGWGVLFEYDDGARAVHAFTGEDGGYAIGPLVQDSRGSLYGVGFIGGEPACFDGCGVVFKFGFP